MYAVVLSKTFKKMIKRLRGSGRFDETPLEEIIDLLSHNKPLPADRRDHPLQGELQDFRECHVTGNLLLVYRKNNITQNISLIKIGTHHEVFGS